MSQRRNNEFRSHDFYSIGSGDKQRHPRGSAFPGLDSFDEDEQALIARQKLEELKFEMCVNESLQPFVYVLPKHSKLVR